jgi:hypothetical protein
VVACRGHPPAGASRAGIPWSGPGHTYDGGHLHLHRSGQRQRRPDGKPAVHHPRSALTSFPSRPCDISQPGRIAHAPDASPYTLSWPRGGEDVPFGPPLAPSQGSPGPRACSIAQSGAVEATASQWAIRCGGKTQLPPLIAKRSGTGDDTCLMKLGEDAQPFVMIPVPDSPESRLFVELSSYGADLAGARDALHPRQWPRVARSQAGFHPDDVAPQMRKRVRPPGDPDKRGRGDRLVGQTIEVEWGRRGWVTLAPYDRYPRRCDFDRQADRASVPTSGTSTLRCPRTSRDGGGRRSVIPEACARKECSTDAATRAARARPRTRRTGALPLVQCGRWA